MILTHLLNAHLLKLPLVGDAGSKLNRLLKQATNEPPPLPSVAGVGWPLGMYRTRYKNYLYYGANLPPREGRNNAVLLPQAHATVGLRPMRLRLLL